MEGGPVHPRTRIVSRQNRRIVAHGAHASCRRKGTCMISRCRRTHADTARPRFHPPHSLCPARLRPPPPQHHAPYGSAVDCASRDLRAHIRCFAQLVILRARRSCTSRDGHSGWRFTLSRSARRASSCLTRMMQEEGREKQTEKLGLRRIGRL